jgi:transposase-like protein
MAAGLQRYKCKDCSKRFNVLTGTPLSRLRHRERWMKQAQAMDDGLPITKAEESMGVARSTAFR